MKIRQTLLALCMIPIIATAQSSLKHNLGTIGFSSDTVSKWNYHIDLGMGVTSGFGATNSYMVVAPTVEYKPNNKWAFQAGFAAINGTNMANFTSQSTRDLAPRRPNSNSSLALAGKISAQYQVTDNLWVAATLWHVAGQTVLPGGFGWYGLMPAGLPVNLDATGVTGEVHYDFGKGNSLGLYFSYINDRTGGMMPMLCDPIYGYGMNPMMGHGFYGYNGAYSPLWY